MTRLAITGLGMVSSVGHDMVTACASLRAGLTCPAPVDFEVPSDEGPGNVPLTGHPLRGITEGFQGMGRYLRMAVHAVDDLVHQAGLARVRPGFWEECALYVGLSRTRNEEIDFYDEILEEQLAASIVEHSELAIPVTRQRVLFHGHASALWALHDASEAMARGRCERALIVGVDSLLDSDALEALYAEDRLKTPMKPRGLMPGEAAAAFLVEPVMDARRRHAVIPCLVEGVQAAREPAARAASARSSGLALSEVIDKLLASGVSVSAIYGDLNGEDARAQEWGNTLVRLSAAQLLSRATQHWPAASLGDTGAASGTISVVAGARALMRGYALRGDVLVWSSADSGEVAAVLLRRGEPSASPFLRKEPVDEQPELSGKP